VAAADDDDDDDDDDRRCRRGREATTPLRGGKIQPLREKERKVLRIAIVGGGASEMEQAKRRLPSTVWRMTMERVRSK
jgi:hypothetical protein